MQPICVITGANRGIGLALCQHYQRNHYAVVAACRQPSAELQDAGVEIVTGVDITSSAGRHSLLAAIGQRKIDLLIHNAGIWCDDVLGDIQPEPIRQAFETNALAPLLLTDALLPQLSHGSKIGLVTSRMGSIEDNGSGGRYGYRMSKAALNAAGKSLAIDLQPRGIALAILHPGFVQTRMVGFAGHITPAESANGLAQRLRELTLETSGSFWHANGERLPW